MRAVPVVLLLVLVLALSSIDSAQGASVAAVRAHQRSQRHTRRQDCPAGFTDSGTGSGGLIDCVPRTQEPRNTNAADAPRDAPDMDLTPVELPRCKGGQSYYTGRDGIVTCVDAHAAPDPTPTTTLPLNAKCYLLDDAFGSHRHYTGQCSTKECTDTTPCGEPNLTDPNNNLLICPPGSRCVLSGITKENMDIMLLALTLGTHPTAVQIVNVVKPKPISRKFKKCYSKTFAAGVTVEGVCRRGDVNEVYAVVRENFQDARGMFASCSRAQRCIVNVIDAALALLQNYEHDVNLASYSDIGIPAIDEEVASIESAGPASVDEPPADPDSAPA